MQRSCDAMNSQGFHHDTMAVTACAAGYDSTWARTSVENSNRTHGEGQAAEDAHRGPHQLAREHMWQLPSSQSAAKAATGGCAHESLSSGSRTKGGTRSIQRDMGRNAKLTHASLPHAGTPSQLSLTLQRCPHFNSRPKRLCL